MSNKRGVVRLSALAVACQMAFAGMAYAQQETAQPQTTAPTGAETQQAEDASTLDAVVVTGFRSTEAVEVADKRDAIEITDGISSDDLGRIPDLNIGEAMQRIPGIQINREGEGREAAVTLRGLPGEYARTTLNGAAFAEPILMGSSPFGAYLSDVFSGVRVEKSQLAHSIAGGVSGNIDLQLTGALSRKEGVNLKAALDYNELGGLYEPNYSIGGNKFLSDNFAVFGTVAYKRENFRRDSVLFNSYAPLVMTEARTTGFDRYLDYYAPAGTCATIYQDVAGCQAAAGGTGALGQTGVQYVSQTRQYMRDNKGTQYSASGGMEWAPSDEWTLGVIGLYTNRDQDGTRQTFQTLNFNNANTTVNPTSEVRPGPDGTFFVEDFDFSNSNNITDSRILPVVQRAWGGNATAEYDSDDLRMKTTVSYSTAFTSTNEQYVSLTNQAQARVNNGVNGSLSSGAGNWDDYALLLGDYTFVSLDPKVEWVQQGPITSPTSWSNYVDSPEFTPGRSTFRITGTQAEAESTLTAVQQDFEFRMQGGPVSSIQTGLRWERTDYTSRGSKVSGFGIDPSAINDSYLMVNPDVGNFFDGSLGGASPFWKVVDVNGIFDAIGPAEVANGTTLNSSGLNNEYADDVNVARYNFSSTTDVMSAYVEAKLDTQLFGKPLRGSLGMRYEATDRSFETLNRIRQYSLPLGSLDDFSVQTLSDSYDYWLPSGILIFEPTENLLLRFAAYKTYVRPHPRQFSPSTVVGIPNGNNEVPVTLGNPDLEPYTADSYDATLEWYNRPGSLVAVSLFQKRITGLIQPAQGAELCPLDGGGLGFGPLEIQGDQCVATDPSLVVDGDPLTLNISGTSNSKSPITVRGVEVGIKQNLDFLPGFWSHLGGGVTYTYNDISGKLPNGQDATLAGVSKENWNVLGYYETDKFGARLTYNYRTDYDVPDAVIFGFGGLARRVSARGQLDASTSFNVTPNVSLSFSAFNITNETRKEYQGSEELARRIDYDGRTYRVAVNVNF